MMRHTAVDMEQNELLLDPFTTEYKIRQKYLCKTCLGLLFSGAFFSLGLYVGYTSNNCDNDSSSFF